MMEEGSGRLRAFLVLGRVSNLPTVWTNCLAGWFLAGGGWGTDFGFLLLGASLLYVGGMYWNDAFDAKFDAEHRPRRPIPAGAVSPATVWVGGSLMFAAGIALVLGGTAASPVLVGALAAAILLYDTVHKKWRGAVLVMGACRLLLVLMAGSAAGTTSGAGAAAFGFMGIEVELGRVTLAGLAVFAYVVGITAVARGESTAGTVLPWAWVPLAAPVLAWLLMGAGWGGLLFVAMFALWLARGARLLRGGQRARVGRFVGHLLAGIVLVDAMMVSALSPSLAWICVAFLALNLLLQRHIPAT
ncbi:MAG: UbiA family prenyltransferase [Verrucomicrobiales bacterium]